MGAEELAARIETMNDDFRGMRQTGAIHVDKTKFFYDLIISNPLAGLYFVSRPLGCSPKLVI